MFELEDFFLIFCVFCHHWPNYCLLWRTISMFWRKPPLYFRSWGFKKLGRSTSPSPISVSAQVLIVFSTFHFSSVCGLHLMIELYVITLSHIVHLCYNWSNQHFNTFCPFWSISSPKKDLFEPFLMCCHILFKSNPSVISGNSAGERCSGSFTSKQHRSGHWNQLKTQSTFPWLSNRFHESMVPHQHYKSHLLRY